jgi:hypothetical protein
MCWRGVPGEQHAFAGRTGFRWSGGPGFSPAGTKGYALPFMMISAGADEQESPQMIFVQHWQTEVLRLLGKQASRIATALQPYRCREWSALHAIRCNRPGPVAAC